VFYVGQYSMQITARGGSGFRANQQRRRIVREMDLRRGQPKFRDRLVRRYGEACQISRCTFAGLVEAAHIKPYAESNENGVHNGLLLRSDLHKLFDLGLLAIHPQSLTVALHRTILEMGYRQFDGLELFTNGSAGPDRVALAKRWDTFISKPTHLDFPKAAGRPVKNPQVRVITMAETEPGKVEPGILG